MILAVDIGNSNIVVGGIRDDEITFEARLRTDSSKTSDEYAMDLKNLLSVYGYEQQDVDGAIIASVVPQALNSFQTAIKKLTGKTSLVVGPGLKTGLNIRIDHPEQTGADLVAGMVGALQSHRAPLIVVDMGTATTMCVVDQSGTFIGAAIMPGVRISLKALTAGTALLPGLQLDNPKKVIGKNTVDSMRSGSMIGAAAMVDGMVERMEEELGCKTTVIMTGGIGKFIEPLCKTPVQYDRQLILKGLLRLYKMNMRQELQGEQQ